MSGTNIGEKLTTIAENMQKVYEAGKQAKKAETDKLLTSLMDRSITSITLPEGTTTLGKFALRNCSQLKTVNGFEHIEYFDQYSMYGCSNFVMTELPPNVRLISTSAFSYCPISIEEIPASVDTIHSSVFSGLKTPSVTFKGTPTTLSATAFKECTINEIRVPWAEGEVANAPWGATDATIIYNYTEEE